MSDNKHEKNQDKDDTLKILPRSWLETARVGAQADADAPEKMVVELRFFASRDAAESATAELHAWQRKLLTDGKDELLQFEGPRGPVWMILPSGNKTETPTHGGLLEDSPYARARDLTGRAYSQMKPYKPQSITVRLEEGLSDDELLGALTGLEIASYRYREQAVPGAKPKELPGLTLVGNAEKLQKLKDEAQALGRATNLARHLVNLPACDLNPKTYSKAARELFSGSKNVAVEIWGDDRLEEERMGLILAVGAAAKRGPRLVHLRYRPAGAKGAPVAFVGKGITFDSGGLDLKPSRSMRLMKKDMGGSAAVLGLCYWMERTQVPMNADFYLALAENSVGGASFRPGDVLVARNGMSVEIDNTDAEGRLVLADALDVAVKAEGEHKPELVIDVATLTGACKVGLGTDIIGMFANDDRISGALLGAGHAAGDLCWRYPLYEGYRSQLKSSVADMSNSGGAYGGAITAALFLAKFVGKTPWAHLDIYAWKDSASGAHIEAGGSGQPVQCLAEFVRQRLKPTS